MKILIGNIWYSTPEGSSIRITRSMSDPVPTCAVHFRDNTSAFNIIPMQEILVIDDQVYPNPTINYNKNPDLNPYNSIWTPSSPTGTTLSQASPGGLNIACVNVAAGTQPILQQRTDPTVAPILPAQTYTLSMYAQGTVGNSNIEIYLAIQWKDVNNVLISASTFTSSAPVPTTATRYTLQATAPANAYYANIQLGLVFTSSTNSGTITFTNTQFEPLWFSTLSYPTPFCGPNQTNCQQLPNNALWIRQYRKFAGFVNWTSPSDYHGNVRTIQVTAVGYAWLAGTIIGNDTFSSQTDKQIIQTLLSKYFLNAGTALCSTTNVVAGVTLSSMQLNWDDLRTAFDGLASSSTFYWTIDYYWAFIYAPGGYISMPIALICDNSSNPDMVTTYPAYNFRPENDFTQPGSNILVLGNGSNTAQVIDPSQVANLAAISGYSLPATTSWMRKINDSTLASVSDCTQRGMAELIQYDKMRSLYHLNANVELIAGEGIRVTSNTDGLNATMLLIQQVTAQWIGTSETFTDVWEYQADLGAVNRAATNMISRLFRRTNTNTAATAINTVTLAVLENVSVIDQVDSNSTYAIAVLSDSPLRYYRLGEPTGFSISTAYDWSGNTQNGTITGGVTLGSTGLIYNDPNTSYNLDGSSGYVSLPTTGLPTGAAAWSMECWIQMPNPLPSSGSGFKCTMSMGTVGVSNEIAFLYYRTTVQAFRIDVVSTTIQSSVVSAGGTYHVVATYNGTTLTLYLNGVSQGTATVTLNLVAGIAQIGNDNSGDFWTGAEQEVAYYGTALSAARVLAHYNIGKFGHS